MTTTEAILRTLSTLPQSAREEVLDFVEFLRSKYQAGSVREAEVEWSRFSVESAMRGMEDEEVSYTIADLKGPSR